VLAFSLSMAFRDIVRRTSIVAEEVLGSRGARRSSIFASVVKQEEDPTNTYAIAKIHLFAAVMFVLGSAFFVYEEISSQWLLYYRIGCGLFITGCVAYLSAVVSSSGGLTDSGHNISSKVSDALVVVSMVLFIAGSALPLYGEERDVLRVFALISWLFLAGSILLLVDAMKCAVSSHVTDVITLSNYLDLATTICFVSGAVLAGKFYREAPFFVEEGMILWLIGSCCCCIGPTRVLAWRAYDKPTISRKQDAIFYGTMHATLDGRRRSSIEATGGSRSKDDPVSHLARNLKHFNPDDAPSSADEIWSDETAQPVDSPFFRAAP
jgi:hypothetical protein